MLPRPPPSPLPAFAFAQPPRPTPPRCRARRRARSLALAHVVEDRRHTVRRVAATRATAAVRAAPLVVSPSRALL
eukprot:1393333-Prymnesium_polylepis.1